MKSARLIFFCICIGSMAMHGLSQTSHSPQKTSYQLETVGSAATGDHTPFWINSNTYGVMPLDAGNGYLRGQVHHHQLLGNGFYWSAGLDALVVAPREKNVYIQQLYAEIGYKSLLLSVGSKEQYISLWDKRLSSGDMIQSANARPTPEINIQMPAFTEIPWTKGWLQVKGHVAVGRSFDNDYLKDFVNPTQEYTQDILWHHKSAFLRLKDSRNQFPLYGSVGLRHIAQWGGSSTDPAIGEQPHTFKDFMRVFLGRSGGEGATSSDKVNVLGSHHISYDFQVGFAQKDWNLQAYYQHLCFDKSGLTFRNRTDGLWGLQLDLPRFSPIQKVVIEYVTTKNQSGPFHFIDFDHEKHPGRGGGADDYYNNGEYPTGLSYFNQAIGSPLLPSPIYNKNGTLGFLNNRIQDWHIGLEGNVSAVVFYQALITVMNGWGTAEEPFLRQKTGVSLGLKIDYTPQRLKGWTFFGSLAGDTGNILGEKSYGLSIGIRKQGILKTW